MIGAGMPPGRGAGGMGWTPARLLTGRPGLWAGGVNPVRARMWQDSAGLTLATQPGDPVGRLAAQRGGGVAVQGAALPAHLICWPKGGRRNLLLASSDFASATWSKVQSTLIHSNADAAPDGSLSADRIEGSASSGGQHVFQQITLPDSVQVVLSICARPVTGGFDAIRLSLTGRDGATRWGAVTLSTGAAIGTSGATVLSGSALGNGWRRVAVRMTTGSGAGICSLRVYGAGENGDPFVLATGKQISVWGAQIEQGSALSPYQQVNSAVDIVEAGRPPVWHLTAAAGEGLSIALPGGSYGVAGVTPQGQVSAGTVTSDGLTPVALLTAPRLADLLLREEALAPEELDRLTEYWQRRYGG